MKRIALPNALEGEWHHLLILTYTVDIPFFENALWRNLNNRCRNKIILADGRRYLEACANYARSGLPRHLNQQYVAEGVFTNQAAHAKVILVTHPERGRLLIGSGNLGMQGYASDGEMFTQYEYSSDAPQTLNAFLAARELIEHLISRRYVSTPAERRFQHLLEKTPWLFTRPQSEWRPVRHNLNTSFLQQLQDVVGQRKVEELWVLSPFYDPQAVALRRLLDVFSPGETTLLVQPGHTSVDDTVLQNVLNQGDLQVRVQPFRTGRDRQYVHAKLYLLKLEERTICLQGSPNLSQVAMLLTDPRGNIEVANLFEGPRDAFDDLFDDLEFGLPTVDVAGLDLFIDRPTPEMTDSTAAWQLLSGDWQRNRMRIVVRGALPAEASMILVIGEQQFAADVLARVGSTLELRLPPEAIALLARPVPVALQLGSGAEAETSNPIFPCNQSALDAVIQVTADSETLDRIGGLDLEDDEFERLLGELDSALMIDRRSVWQLAGRTPPSSGDEDDEALRLDYIDVDYDLLRRHPKIQQYLHRKSDDAQYTRSRLQIILNAITDHFHGLLDSTSSFADQEIDLLKLDGSEADTEQEREEQVQEVQQRRRTSQQRLRNLLKRFVRRYLRGISSRDFQQLAGHEVMAQNYIIFSHILWRLFAKDWVEHTFIVESFLETWRFFWGTAESEGYFSSLDSDQQKDVRRWAKEYHADSLLLAALYQSDLIAVRSTDDRVRFELRDLWRRWLELSPLSPTVETIEVCWHLVAELSPYDPPRPTDIVDRLTRLARYQTRDSFLRAVERRFRFARNSCRFTDARVCREALNREDTVQCLTIQDIREVLDKQIAVAVIEHWMTFESLEYYRVEQAGGNQPLVMIFYETHTSSGVYWDRKSGLGEEELGTLAEVKTLWSTTLDQLRSLADTLDADLRLSVMAESRLHVPKLGIPAWPLA